MLPLVSWENGTIMIGVFAAVCIILVAVLLKFMFSTDKKNQE